MIIVRVMGGLGNQLQQYALYRKYLSMGTLARLDLAWFSQSIQDSMAAPRRFELSDFGNLPLEKADREEVRALLGRTYEEQAGFGEKIKRRLLPRRMPVFEESEMFHEEILSWDNRYLVGYWACEAYYADILPTLREEIRFPNGGDERNRETMKEMAEQTAVSIHVRRGDYLDAENAAMFGGICTEAYYDAAIRYIKERCPGAVFYVFSDDAAYARDHYRGAEYRIVDWNRGADSFYDMQLMSCCKHSICANSTFSFWGARLNGAADKIMIRPSIHKNTQVCVPEQMKKLWAGWTLVTPAGEVV
ncbi:MAG: alpha-1,2-fucosyltransferase [Lachnospiraceae bacterium]|nr:alpha-1,2-fucosyltransferase [Lachnospiraceae bacterium]MDE7177664.1 alpha-1,2-fucosyltransferase [Lachnospiraceae bacterium]